jgi:hypothetical protein
MGAGQGLAALDDLRPQARILMVSMRPNEELKLAALHSIAVERLWLHVSSYSFAPWRQRRSLTPAR